MIARIGFDSPPEPPRVALRVGVVGQTALTQPVAWSRPDVDAALDGLVAACVEAAGLEAGLYGPQRVQLRLMTCLAPGFDQLVANAWTDLALSRAEPASLVTTWVLPQPAAQYLARPGLGAAEAIFARSGAAATSRVELDLGSGAEEATSDLAATRFVVQHSDVLISGWDGSMGRPGAGGGTSLSRRAVELALVLGIPVLWVQPQAWDPDALSPEARAIWKRMLPASAARAPVLRILTPFGECARPPTETPPRAGHGAVDATAAQLSHYARYLHVRMPPQPVERLMTGLWSGCWAWLGRLVDRDERRRAIEAGGSPPGPSPADNPPANPARDMPTGSPTWSAHRVADHLAQRMRGVHRGSLVLIAVLGTLAVALALAGFLLKKAECETGMLIVIPAELGVIGCILRTYDSAREHAWHELSVEYRALAEMLRVTSWTWTFGAPYRPEPPFAHRASRDEQPTWMRWYHDALVRALDPAHPAEAAGVRILRLESLDGRIGRCREAWIEAQADYYSRTRQRYEKVHSLAEWGVHWLFGIALLGAIVSCVLVALHVVAHVDAPTWLLVTLVAIGTVGPALAAALHGLLSQLEAERLAVNFRRMASALGVTGGDLQCLREKLASDPRPQDLESVQDKIHEAARAMLMEVDDWHASARVHPLNLP